MHKMAAELSRNETFVMAGGHYRITSVTDLSDDRKVRVRFVHVNAIVNEEFTLDIAKTAFFATY